MKRIASLLVALTLCFSLFVPALAVGNVGESAVADQQGNTHTLSSPILYTIPSADVINSEGNEMFKSAMERAFADIPTIYAVKSGSQITAPAGIDIGGEEFISIKWDAGKAAIQGYGGGGPIQSTYSISNPGCITIFLIYKHSGILDGADYDDPSSAYNEDAFIGGIAVYAPLEGQESANPFASNASIPAAPTPAKPSFTDVPDNAYYAKPVAWAVENGVTNGTSKTTFSPDMTCTVEQIITFLWRAYGSPTSEIQCPFEVSKDSPYYMALCWANEKSVLGSETTAPDVGCSRAMAMTYIWRAAGKPNAKQGTATFSDVAGNTYYADAVAWAVEDGVTNGTSSTTFSPDTICSRGQIVTFLWRSFVKA